MVCLGHDLPDLAYDKPHEAYDQKCGSSLRADYLLKGFVCRRNDVNCPFPTRYDGK